MQEREAQHLARNRGRALHSSAQAHMGTRLAVERCRSRQLETCRLQSKYWQGHHSLSTRFSGMRRGRSFRYRRFLFLSQNRSPATFDFFAELPPASATVTFAGPAPPRPSWKASPTPTTNAPAAGANSTQPFGQEVRLNANTACSGRSCAWAGSVAMLRMTNENALAIRMRSPS
jgi:hypothetical protein